MEQSNLMDNVFLQRREKNAYKVFSREGGLKSNIQYDAGVLIHLHYVENIEEHFNYIENIPDTIDVMITSSEASVLEILSKHYKYKTNISVIRKENRGRDISALLVAGRDFVQKHKYICFVHDKKSSRRIFDEDVRLWNRNLWENMIGSERYIEQVLLSFEQNEKLGLMLPPEPIGRAIGAWYISSWGRNFENTLQLARTLDLKADIQENYPPISIGTVFWAKTDALKKLLEKEWRYDDFPEEPMATDGTISHAIERILPYVAQDAGYESCMCMTDEYAETLLSYAQDYMFQMSDLIGRYIGGSSIRRIQYLRRLETEAVEYASKHSSLYLYGAGVEGVRCLNFLLANGITPDGFVVSKKPDHDSLYGYPVIIFENIKNILETAGVIVSVINEEHKQEIIRLLEENNIFHYLMWKE